MSKTKTQGSFALFFGTLMGLFASFASGAEEGRNIGGGFQLTPALEADGVYSDNFYYQARNKDAVYGAILRPNGRIVSARGRLKLGLKGGAQFGVFDSPSDNDNYIDNNAEAEIGWQFDTRNRTSLTLNHTYGHDPFGQQRTESLPATLGQGLDVWHSDGLAAGYRYGVKDAPINIEVSVSALQKHYDSNQASTAQLNNNNISARSEIFYNYSPKTAAVLEASAARVYFTDPSARSRNGVVKSVLGGLRWKATAQTTGDVRVGYVLRNYDDTSSRRFQAINWNASVTWAPLVLTSFKLTTGRTAQDSYNNARFVDNRFTVVEVNQKFSDRFSAGLRGSYTRSKFVEASRNDDVYNAGINASYTLNKTVALVAGANYAKRDTDFPVIVTPMNIFDLNYESNSAFVGVRLTP